MPPLASASLELTVRIATAAASNSRFVQPCGPKFNRDIPAGPLMVLLLSSLKHATKS
jgi:hypothetical protein